jgi:hypothetical protein
MKTKTFTLFSAMTLFAALGITAQTFAQKDEGQIITFDAGTDPVSINPSGEITGDYFDVSGVHGFVRAADGTITIFGPSGTNPQSINPRGEITGSYIDSSTVYHAFLYTKHQPKGRDHGILQ